MHRIVITIYRGHPLEDRRLASIGELEDVSEVQLIDEWNRNEGCFEDGQKLQSLAFSH